MSSVHCIVVWEWQSGGHWLPHTPGVSRTLERAHAKKLTRVVLADAEPALRGHYVNLRTLTQCFDMPEGGSLECAVRRWCYSVASAGGRGVRWEWARDPLPMEVQNCLEEAWCRGEDTVAWSGWTLCISRMRARSAAAAAAAGGDRALRRLHQPPYPLAVQSREQNNLTEPRRPRIPRQHTGSSVHSIQSNHSVQSSQSLQSNHSIQSSQSIQSNQSKQSVQTVKSCPSNQSNTRSNGARSVSPAPRKTNLARQILHNLNIFSNSNKPSNPTEASACDSSPAATDTESSSSKSRRHSVDTVSTYLSCSYGHQVGVDSLLNVSAGSDEVFDAPAQQEPAEADHLQDNSDDMELLLPGLAAHVVAVSVPQWGALCWLCVRALGRGTVALRRCHHTAHLRCLYNQLRHNQQDSLYIECLVCGEVYGDEGGGTGGVKATGGGKEAGGAQPAGSLAWQLLQEPLPQHPAHTGSILLTYNFQSGRQGPLQPAPGAPYYAVGFPRYSVLPDTQLGRHVARALRLCWETGSLFHISASVTTGREWVVSWRTPPPPAQPAHYAPPAHAPRLLQASLQRLHALLPARPACCAHSTALL